MKTITTNMIRTLQIAARDVGLRKKDDDGRYKLLLMQYKTPSGKPAQSCKELNFRQFEDLMAICESMGYCHNGNPRYWRDKRDERGELCSFAQRAAIKKLADDLLMGEQALQHFCQKMGGKPLTHLSTKDASNVIEALKAIVGRADNHRYEKVKDVEAAYGDKYGHSEVVQDIMQYDNWKYR